MYRIEIWTDGSFSRASGKGGWAAIITARKPGVAMEDIEFAARAAWMSLVLGSEGVAKHEDFRVKVLTGKAEKTTNNRMEMKAIIEAVRAIGAWDATIFTDSKYATIVLGEKGKRIKANHDLIGMWKLMEKGEITFSHVNGHSGYGLNELADQMAREECYGKTAAA